jgi:alpha-glucosidase
LVTILDPGVKRDPSYTTYQDGLSEGVFCRLPDGSLSEGVVWPGWSVFPDFTDPAVRRWWGRGYQSLLDQGVAGFWHDMNEPTSFTAWGEVSPPLATRHDLEGQGGDHRQGHNLYGMLMNKAGYEGLRQLQPQQRPWILSRSGWVGGIRYAWNWTGDTDSTWDGLKLTLATVLNLGLSGVSFTGPDIGGFSGSPTPELHTRWFQMAAFLPFFRTHSARGTARREPWSFDEATLEILRHFLRLRYRLLPYLYTLAWQTSKTGVPPVRPLFWVDWQDRNTWTVDDAFMLGDALLIAPVLEAQTRSRRVYLPEGVWFDFWEGERHLGAEAVELPAPMDRIPVLVRAGSILPTEQGGKLRLDVYPTQEGLAAGEVFGDAGDGFGDWRLDRYSLQLGDGEAVLTRESEGGYPLPYEIFEIRLHGIQVRSASVDGRPAPLEGQRVRTGPFQRVQFILDS